MLREAAELSDSAAARRQVGGASNVTVRARDARNASLAQIRRAHIR